MLPPSVDPAVGRIQDRQHGAPLGALPDLTRPREQLRLPAAQPVDRDEHEVAVKRLDQLGALKRDGVVGEEIVEAARRRPRRRLHPDPHRVGALLDRKSTRLNSSHLVISYAVFCLKKKKKKTKYN